MGKVIVFGSLNMDISIEADKMPQQGETIGGKNLVTSPGGKGANQAVAAALMGAEVHMIGAVGADKFGRDLKQSLTGYGVNAEQVDELSGVSTGVAVIVRVGGDNRIILDHGANYARSADNVKAVLDGIAEPGDVFLTQFECELSTTFELIKYAHDLGLYTMVNPSPAATMTTGLLASVDVLCLNEIEFADLFGKGKISPLAEPEAAVQKVLASGVSTAVLTLGSKGSIAADAHGGVYQQKCYHVDTVDTTCAGDTFMGTLAAFQASGQLEERGIKQALDVAAKAAALATTKVGAQQSIPTYQQVVEF